MRLLLALGRRFLARLGHLHQGVHLGLHQLQLALELGHLRSPLVETMRLLTKGLFFLLQLSVEGPYKGHVLLKLP